MLLLILNLVQLKRFASLCKFRLNKNVGSIRNALIVKLKQDREG
jgi:hypothetical protein